MIIGFDAKRAFHNASGLGNYSRDMIRVLSEFYPQHNYLLYNPKRGRIHWQPPAASSVRYPASSLWRILSSIWRQGPIVDQLKADGVQIYHGLSNEIPLHVERAGIRSVVTIHDLIFIRYPQLFKPVDRKIYLRKFRHAAEKAHVVVAISQQTKRDIAEFFDIPEDKIVVHYQGCHQAFKESYETEEKEALRARLRLPHRFILNVGTVEERKNALVLLQALRGSNEHLVIVGKSTAYKQKLVDFSRKHGLDSQIHFVEGLTVRELAMVYQMATIFCYPSIFEGFGIPVIEALFSGVPVITSTGSCFAEAGGPHTVYIDPYDILGWRHALESLLSNSKERQEASERGRAWVQKFTDDQVAGRLIRIYENLVHL